MLITALALACLAQESESKPQDLAAIPLPRRALPADTAFVLHFDARAFLASAWWRALGDMPELSEALANSDELRMVREQLGLDPFEDLLSITVLGRDDKGDGAAVLVRTTDAADGVVEQLRGADVHGALEHAGLPLDRWGDDTDGVYASYHATPNGDRVAILGRTAGDVARVVKAADGELPRLADAPRPAIDAAPRAGTFLYVEVGLPLGGLLGDSPVALVANNIERTTLELGERDGKVFAEMKVRAKDRDAARRVADIVNGARAFLSNLGLVEQLPLPVQDLYDGLVAEVSGSDVRFGLAMSPRDIEYLLDELRTELR